MADRLDVDVERMLGMSNLHAAVSESLGALDTAGPPTAATHGLVASTVSSALDGVLASRGNALRSTSASGQQISTLLHGAAEAYRAGDEESAHRLMAAAESMQGSPSVGSAATAVPAPAAP
ncbi:MAG: type VII secretion target, partial [Mycobacterium sp.]